MARSRWSLCVCGILLALLPAVASEAKTLWISPSGNDASIGDQTHPLRTIAKANALMLPGDVARILPGTYSDLPNPTAAATGGLRFTYIGTSTTADPLRDTLSRSTIVLPGGSISKSYVTLKGVRVSGGLGCSESGDRDSILDVSADGGFDHQGGDYDVYARCKFKGGKFNLNKNTLGSSVGVQIYGCDFPYVGQNQTSGDHNWLVWNADSTVEMFNRRLITIESGLPSDVGGEWHFDDRHRVSRGNYTVIRLNRTSYAVWRWRSDTSVNIGSYNNTFDQDTIIVVGTSPTDSDMLPSSSANCGTGSFLAQCVGQWGTTMDSCYINASGVQGNVHFYFQGGMTNWTITRTVIAMSGTAILAFDVHGSRIANCTLAGSPVCKWTDSYGRPIWQAGDMMFSNNIVNSWGNGCVLFDATMKVAGAYLVSKNLYWGCGSVPPWPADATSLYADPMFVSGGKGVGFDPHLRAGSPAVGLGAGALGVDLAPDTIPPAPVADLR